MNQLVIYAALGAHALASAAYTSAHGIETGIAGIAGIVGIAIARPASAAKSGCADSTAAEPDELVLMSHWETLVYAQPAHEPLP